MAIVISPDETEIEELKKKPKYNITPRYSAWIIEDKFVVEVGLPGVRHEDVKIKALQDFFALRADRENITYWLDLNLSFKIEPDKVTSKFTEGLLHVEFDRFDPLKHSYSVMTPKEAGEGKEKKQYHKVFPKIYRHVDYKNNEVKLELSIPGVKEDDIDLRVRPTWFYLSAVRADESMEYSANQSFGADIVPEKTKAEYFSGLLKITAIIRDPMDDAKEITFE
jgi:HSP20 family molecular chaperone IbpA